MSVWEAGRDATVTNVSIQVAQGGKGMAEYLSVGSQDRRGRSGTSVWAASVGGGGQVAQCGKGWPGTSVWAASVGRGGLYLSVGSQDGRGQPGTSVWAPCNRYGSHRGSFWSAHFQLESPEIKIIIIIRFQLESTEIRIVITHFEIEITEIKIVTLFQLESKGTQPTIEIK